MISLNKLKSKKTLLIAGVALLIVGGIYRFFPDTGQVLEDDTMVQKQLKLNKYQALVGDEQKLKTALAAATQMVNSARQMLLQADTTAIAAVEIQDRVQQIAGRHGLAVEAMRFLEPVKIEAPELKEYLAVPIQFSIDATIEKVKSLLYDLEASDKLITVQEIRARAKNVGNEITISATFVIWGYMKAKTDDNPVERPA
jgi:hypothetical protein